MRCVTISLPRTHAPLRLWRDNTMLTLARPCAIMSLAKRDNTFRMECNG